MAYIGKAPGGTGVRQRYLYTATSGQTTFTTSDSGLALSYSDTNYMDVYQNGVLLDPANDYTATSGTSVVLGTGATTGDVIEIIVYDVFSVFNNTVTGNFTVGNNLTVSGTSTLATVDINAGNIDGTTIGAATPAAGTFTTLTTNGNAVISSANARLRLKETDTTDVDTQLQTTGGVFKISRLDDDDSTATQRFTIDNSTGDISFYEDTGTTAKLFWDASAEALGIGTSSPASTLHVNSGTANTAVTLESTDAACWQVMRDPTADIFFGNNGGNYLLYTGGTPRMQIDSSGNVGIGTTSTTNDAKLIVSGTDGKHPLIKVSDGGGNGYTLLADNYTASESQVNFGISFSSASAVISRGVKVSDTTDDVYLSSQALYATKPTAFKLGSDGSFRFLNTDTSATTAVDTAVTLTERMRITSNGNLLVGKSVTSGTTAGMAWIENEYLQLVNTETATAARALLINRQSADGVLVEFRKANALAGSIYTNTADGGSSSELCIASGNTGLKFDDTNNYIRPTNSAGAHRDDTVSLGTDNSRFKDLYLSSKAIINRDSDDDFIQLQRSGTTRARIGITSTDNLYIDATTNGGAGLQFWGSGGSDPYITPREEGSDNDNVTSLGRGANRFKDLYLGGGLYVGGTGSANYLDDFEEGTFTPTYVGSSSNPTITYDTQAGEYVKIGRQVIARVELKTDAVSGGSGNVYISGLPFAPVGNSGVRAGSAVVAYSSSWITEEPQAGYLNDGTSRVVLVTNNSSDARTGLNNTVQVTNMGTGTNDNFLMATLFYTAS